MTAALPERAEDEPVATTGSRPTVSVVIPCRNEVQSIGACVDSARRALEDAGYRGEVVVADNGSSDGSRGEAARHGARVVIVDRRGYGSAVRGGIAESQGEYIVVGDGDGQHDFGEIPRFLGKLDEGYELVVGNRFAGDMLPGSMSWSHRYVGNPVLSGLLRFLFHPKIHDAQCGLRALTRHAFVEMDLRTTGFELCPEMVVKAARHRLASTEVPITVRPDQRDRPPHLRTVPDGWRHLMFILMCAPNWLFILPGCLLLAAGIAFVSWLYSGPQHVGSVGLDTRAQLFGVIFASVGFQIASIGIFARVYSYSDPRRVRSRSLERVLGSMRLEQGIAVGVCFILIGVVGDAWEYVRWASHGFGVLQHDRAIVFWSMWLLLGIQICFVAVFLSMIGISRGTWIGSGRDTDAPETSRPQG